jgi:hypothetical protein
MTTVDLWADEPAHDRLTVTHAAPRPPDVRMGRRCPHYPVCSGRPQGSASESADNRATIAANGYTSAIDGQPGCVTCPRRAAADHEATR